MGRTSHRDRLVAAIKAEDGLNPPPGDCGFDRDGAMIYFGARPDWTPDREGQRAAVLPPTGRYVRHPMETCPTCGAVSGLDTRRSEAQTCAGCMRAGDRQEYRIIEEKARDDAAATLRASREAESKGPQDFASRKFRGKKVKDRAARS